MTGQAVEQNLPTDNAPEENPMGEVGKELNEKIREDLGEEAEAEADAGDSLGDSLGGMADLTGIFEMLHKVTEAVGSLSAAQATPGQAQSVHVTKDDEEEEERKYKKRQEQQRQAAAEAAQQLDDGREDDR